MDLKYKDKEDEKKVSERIIKSLIQNPNLFLTNKWDRLYLVKEQFGLGIPGTKGAASGKIDFIFLGINSNQYDLIIVELKINKSSPEMIGQGLAYLTFFSEIGGIKRTKLINLVKKTVSENNIDPNVLNQIDELIENTHLLLLDQWASYENYHTIKKQLCDSNKIHYFCFGVEGLEGNPSFGNPDTWNCIIDADFIIGDENARYKIISEKYLDQISKSVLETLISLKMNNYNFELKAPGRLHRSIKYSMPERSFSIDIYGQVTRIYILIHGSESKEPIHGFPIDNPLTNEIGIVDKICKELEKYF